MCTLQKNVLFIKEQQYMYFIWAIYESQCFLCVNIMVVSVFWSEQKLIYNDLVDLC